MDNPQPEDTLVRAIEAKHAAPPAAPTCALCKGAITAREAHQVVVIASRVEPLFVHAEQWCEACGTLVKGMGLFRHVHYPKRVP